LIRRHVVHIVHTVWDGMHWSHTYSFNIGLKEEQTK